MKITIDDTVVIRGDGKAEVLAGAPFFLGGSGPFFEDIFEGEVFLVLNSTHPRHSKGGSILVSRGDSRLRIPKEKVVLVETHKPSYHYTVCDMYRDTLQITSRFTEALTYCDTNPDTRYITRFDNATAKTHEWKKDKNGMFYHDVLEESV